MEVKALKMYHFVNDDACVWVKVIGLHYSRFHPCIVYIANPEFHRDWDSNKDLNGDCEVNILDIVLAVNMILAGSE